MNQRIANMALVVRDYDEAIEFYVNTLGFDLVEDTVLTPEKRWVRIRPKGATETCLLYWRKPRMKFKKKLLAINLVVVFTYSYLLITLKETTITINPKA